MNRHTALFLLTFSDASAVTCDGPSIAAECETRAAMGVTLRSCVAVAAPVAAPVAPPSAPRGWTAVTVDDPSNVRAGAMDTEGRDRANRDADDLRAAGHTVAAAVYAVGSRVNSTGVANARKSRSEWMQRPTVADAMTALRETIATEGRRDVDAPNRFAAAAGDPGLAMGSSTGALRLPDGSIAAVTGQALRGLLSRVGPGGGGADYLAACPTDLRAAAINRHLKDASNREEETMRIRTRAAVDAGGRPTGGREAYAIVSDSYTPFDADAIADVVARALSGSGLRADVDYNRDRSAVRIEAIAHSDVAPEKYVAGETFKAGIVVRSRDDGGGALIVDSVFERNLCLNLIILQHGSRPLARVTHLSDRAAMIDTLRAAVRDAERLIRPFLARWSVASSERVHAPARSTDAAIPVRIEEAIPGFYRAILTAPSNRLLLPVGASPEKAIPEIVKAWSREADDTRTGIVNGLTRWAHETVGGVDQDDVAVIAGRVLASTRPLLWAAPPKGTAV